MKNKIILILTLFSVGCSDKQDKWDATGTFEANEITVSAEANGKILELNIEEGDEIEIGKTIGVIDTMQLHFQAAQITSKLKSIDIRKPNIQKQIAALNEQLNTAKQEVARAKRLVDANAGNQKTVDDLQGQIAVINSQIEAQQSTLEKNRRGADAEIETLQYQLMAINDQIAKSRIISPITGTILTKYAEISEMTAVGKPIFKIADLELIYLRAYLTVEQIINIKIGQEVDVFTDNNKEYNGRITWISEKSEFTPKGVMTKNERANLVYAIKTAVKNDGLLKIGQYAEIKL